MKFDLTPHDSSISVPVWLAARAKNASRRYGLIGATSGAVFVATLVALALAPERRHPIPVTDLIQPLHLDTLSITAATTRARARLASADSALRVLRSRVAEAKTRSVSDTLNPGSAARRDALSASLDGLQRLLDKVVTSPLPSSYDALAASPTLAGNRRVPLLLDSLNQIEQTRDTLGTSGSTDPVFIALTSRITDLGRSIQEIAEARRDDLRSAIDAMGTQPTPSPAVGSADLDTIPWVAERDSAHSELTAATQALALDRDSLAANAGDVEAQRKEAEQYVSRLDMLAAALVVGLAVGFGVALLGELLRPRIADEHELERLTHLRVVATVRPTAPIPDRARRSADHSTPPSIEGSADPYQLTYLYLSRDEPDPLLLTLTGDDASIVAVTAANLAALSAAAASRVLVIDTDTSRAPIAATFAIQAGPGFADIGRVATEWTGLTTHVQVGRDRTIAVIPSGVGSPPSAESVAAFIRETGPRFAREYDAILVVAPIDRVPNDANAPIASWAPDTLICARVGHTLLNTLAQQIDTLRGVGAHPIGVLLWNAPLPTRPTSRESGAARRPLPKQEKAPTAAR